MFHVTSSFTSVFPFTFHFMFHFMFSALNETNALYQEAKSGHSAREEGLTALVDGTMPEEIDTLAGIETALPVAFLVIIASIFVLLFLMTGSLIMPIKAIILNILSLSATFGGLVWIFQDGDFQNLLNDASAWYVQLVGTCTSALALAIYWS